MTPATARACGERPAAMLRHLVALSFNNIENLYAHLGWHDQMPLACRKLTEMTEFADGRRKYERTVYSSGATDSIHFRLCGLIYLLSFWNKM